MKTFSGTPAFSSTARFPSIQGCRSKHDAGIKTDTNALRILHTNLFDIPTLIRYDFSNSNGNEEKSTQHGFVQRARSVGTGEKGVAENGLGAAYQEACRFCGRKLPSGQFRVQQSASRLRRDLPLQRQGVGTLVNHSSCHRQETVFCIMMPAPDEVHFARSERIGVVTRSLALVPESLDSEVGVFCLSKSML